MFYDIQEQYNVEVELIEPMKKFCGQFDRRILCIHELHDTYYPGNITLSRTE